VSRKTGRQVPYLPRPLLTLEADTERETAGSDTSDHTASLCATNCNVLGYQFLVPFLCTPGGAFKLLLTKLLRCLQPHAASGWSKTSA
jgi:hypothetical protein